jgi:hypothetical protein
VHNDVQQPPWTTGLLQARIDSNPNLADLPVRDISIAACRLGNHQARQWTIGAVIDCEMDGGWRVEMNSHGLAVGAETLYKLSHGDSARLRQL